MRVIGEAPEHFWSFNTCWIQKRLFGFHHDGNKLLVTEIQLGRHPRFVKQEIPVRTMLKKLTNPGCCSLGDAGLVLFSDEENAYAVVVRVSEGALSAKSVSLTELSLRGIDPPDRAVFLCELPGNRVLLNVAGTSAYWVCTLSGEELVAEKLSLEAPEEGFMTVPLPLPDGRLAFAGAAPWSVDVVALRMEDLSLEVIGKFPGEPLQNVSTVLLADRFILGFGGWGSVDSNELWVLDIESGESSLVRKAGDWHTVDIWSPLVIHGGGMYILGGNTTRSVYLLQLSDLAFLIQDPKLRESFRRALGLPMRQVINLSDWSKELSMRL